MTYREALKQGIREALHADGRVFLIGEDVGRYGGAFAVSKGLLQEFGEDRIMFKEIDKTLEFIRNIKPGEWL